MTGLGNRRPSRGAGSRPPIAMFLTAMVALLSGAAASPSWAQPDLEAFLRIEINATDGDVGFHGEFDGDASREMQIKGPDGKTIYSLKLARALKQQGLAESFFESDEPTCQDQPLGEFLARFPAGTYSLQGKTTDGEKLNGEAILSHALPAAPDISATDGVDFNGAPVVIQWGPGSDLGNCHDASLVTDGTIPDPAGVPVDTWEVVVEPDEDELEALGLPERVFSVQVPSGQQSVTVPAEYLQPYVDAGITTFKFEVGAKAGENQTFSEGSFTP